MAEPDARDLWSGLTVHETLLVEQQRTQDASEQEGRSELTYALVGVVLFCALLQWAILPWAKRLWPKGLGGTRHRSHQGEKPRIFFDCWGR